MGEAIKLLDSNGNLVELGWMDDITDFNFPTYGWFGLSMALKWDSNNPYNDIPTLDPPVVTPFSLLTAIQLPSTSNAAYTVVKPYINTKETVTHNTGYNVVQETIYGALEEGQGYIFNGVFTGANNAECFQNALSDFAASAVSRGFYPDITTAKERIFTIGYTDITGLPDPALILQPYTTLETSYTTIANLFVYFNLTSVRDLIVPTPTDIPFTLTVGGEPVQGAYTWTATGRTFKKKPPFTLDNVGLPLASWWGTYQASAQGVSNGLPETLHWDIELASLGVTVS